MLAVGRWLDRKTGAAPARIGRMWMAKCDRALTGGGIRHDKFATPIFGALVIAGIVMRMRRFDEPLEDSYAFRQTQTAANVELWHRFGFSLIDYHVPVFGGGVWIHEVPFYQALAYVLAPLLGGVESAGRSISIVAFVVASFALFRVAARVFSGGILIGPVMSLVVFAFAPIDVFYYRAFLIDATTVSLVLLAVLATVELKRRFAWLWFWTFCAGLGVAALSKSSVVFVFTFMILAVLVPASRGWRRSQLCALYGFLAALALAYVAWIQYSGAMNTASNGMSWSMMRWWYFGSSISDWSAFSVVWSRFHGQINLVLILFAVLGAGYVACCVRKWRAAVIGLCVGLCAYVPVFTNLNRVHDYYQLPLYPAVALLAGAGVVAIAKLVGRRLEFIVVLLTIMVCAQFVSNARAELNVGYFGPGAVDYGLLGLAGELKAHTPDRLLILIGSGVDKNDPRLLYEADRIGSAMPLENSAAVSAAIDAAPSRVAVVMGDHVHPETLSVRLADPGASAPVFVLLGNSPGLDELQGAITTRGYRVTYHSSQMTVLQCTRRGAHRTSPST